MTWHKKISILLVTFLVKLPWKWNTWQHGFRREKSSRGRVGIETSLKFATRTGVRGEPALGLSDVSSGLHPTIRKSQPERPDDMSRNRRVRAFASKLEFVRVLGRGHTGCVPEHLVLARFVASHNAALRNLCRDATRDASCVNPALLWLLCVCCYQVRLRDFTP